MKRTTHYSQSEYSISYCGGRIEISQWTPAGTVMVRLMPSEIEHFIVTLSSIHDSISDGQAPVTDE